jgi:hypothetical protein
MNIELDHDLSRQANDSVHFVVVFLLFDKKIRFSHSIEMNVFERSHEKYVLSARDSFRRVPFIDCSIRVLRVCSSIFININ